MAYMSYNFKGLIFDCDGVMIDSEEANRFFYNSILAWFGYPDMTPEQEKYAFMATAQDALKKMLPLELHAKIPEAIPKAINYQSDVMPKVKLMPGFLDFIHEAHAKGLRLAIDTNRTTDGIQWVLDFFALPHYFDPVISSSLVVPKPSPEGVWLICKNWNIKPEESLFIGDSENDRATALNSGAKFAAFGHMGLKGDILAPDYASLAKLLWP